MLRCKARAPDARQHHGRQALRRNRLDEKIVAPQVQHRQTLLDIRLRRQKYDGDIVVTGQLPQYGRQLQAAASGHVDVHQDQFRLKPVENIHRHERIGH